MKVIVVDDEKLAIETLEVMFKRIGGIEVVGAYQNPKKFLTDIINLEADVIFLDIEMGSLSGIQVAQKLIAQNIRIPIVFVTAYDQFAVHAFEVRAIDYLMKPIQKHRLEETLQRVYDKQEHLHKAPRVAGQLTAQMMDSFKLYDQYGDEVKWRTRKVKELFVYLWQHYPESVHRSKIMVDLWREQLEDRATTLMHTSLYQLRKTIKDMNLKNPVSLVNEQYVLNFKINSDVEEIEKIISSNSLEPHTIKNLIDLYKGDYLEEEMYDWALFKQRQLKSSVLSVLEKYVESVIELNTSVELAEKCLEKMLRIEPFNDRYIHLLIKYYGEQKKSHYLVSVIEKLSEKWKNELGMDLPSTIYALHQHYIMVQK